MRRSVGQASIGNVAQALRDGAILVAIGLFACLLSAHTTVISLVAIPLSLAVTALVFQWLGQSINVMTLGGLAIAIGELVDDAVVDVENILRRLKQNKAAGNPRSVREVVRRASVEVRSGIVYATVIVVLVFVPLFALPGIEGRLYYRSVVLPGIIMANIPLALIGSVVAMWIAGVSLSVASLVGFITLAGIATRNGILKISHYINLVKFEGERFDQSMTVRGSLERLTPVLMTALVAAFALTPLLLAADAPGKEILHPVAVVIFGGLVSSTLLDTLLTPVLFWLYGEKATQRLTEPDADAAAGTTGTQQAY